MALWVERRGPAPRTTGTGDPEGRKGGIRGSPRRLIARPGRLMKNCGEFASPGDAYEPQGWRSRPSGPAIAGSARKLPESPTLLILHGSSAG